MGGWFTYPKIDGVGGVAKGLVGEEEALRRDLDGWVGGWMDEKLSG